MTTNINILSILSFFIWIGFALYLIRKIFRLLRYYYRRIVGKMEKDGIPMVQVKRLVFSDGAAFDVDRDEIVLLVGPNNSGKSACLREIKEIIVSGPRGKRQVIKDAQIMCPHTADEIREWMDRYTKTDREGSRRMPYVGRLPNIDIEEQWSNKNRYGLFDIGRLLTLHLTTEERLNAASPTNSIDFAEDVETHPLHRMYIDECFAAQIDEHFHKNFGDHLIVNRGAGPKIKLHVGHENPDETCLNRRAFIEAVSSLPALHEQGDGMRSFVGVLISILATRRRVILLDEPEAFLHPPQAASLGRLVVDHLPEGRQLFIATHSTDFVKGVLDNSNAQVRVIRLTREGLINRTHELNPSSVRSIWSDPLLRYSGILDGLFHDGVVICEGDTDCRFYSAVIQAIKSEDLHKDIVFVHGGGKERIATIIRSLIAVGVPVKAIADFDVLAEESTIRRIIEALGGEWNEFNHEWRIIKDTVDKIRAEKSLDDIRAEIDTVLKKIKSHNLPEESIVSIRNIIRQGSGWLEAKRVGKSYIPPGSQFNTYEKLEEMMCKIGLYVVPVGEVEGFCRQVGGKGPKWALKVLEREVGTDPALEEARKFCGRIADGWGK